MHHSDRRIPDLRMRLPEIVCREAPGRGDACVQLGKSRLRRQEDTDLDIVGQVVAACCANRELRSRCPGTDPIPRHVLQYTAAAALESPSDELGWTANSPVLCRRPVGFGWVPQRSNLEGDRGNRTGRVA